MPKDEKASETTIAKTEGEEGTTVTSTTATGAGDSKESTTSTTTVTKDEGEKSDTFSRAVVEDLRKQSAKYRTAAKSAQELADQTAEKLADIESKYHASEDSASKVREALEKTQQLHSAYEQRIIRAELKAAATQSGMINIDDVFKMADLSQIKLGDDGEVTGVSEQIDALKKDRSYLFKSANTSNKEAIVTPVDNKKVKPPVYKDLKDADEAKRALLSSLK